MPWAAALPLGAAAIGAAGSVAGSLFGNQANRKEAKKNRAFQERMRNTQWQAGVADMEAAGINPALAYSQGGAASPSGSVASQEGLEGGISSAMAARRAEKELKLLAAQTRDVDAAATKKGAETALVGFQQGLADKDIKLREQMFEMIGFDMVRARNMARAQAGTSGKNAALINMFRSSIFGGGGGISPLRLQGGR